MTRQVRTCQASQQAAGRRRQSTSADRRRPRAPPLAADVGGLGFVVPLVRLHGSALRVPALRERLDEPAPLHPGHVRHRQGAVRRARHLPGGVSLPAVLPTVGHTAFFVVVSLFFQYTIGLALAVFFQRNFPLSPVLRALFLVPWLLPIIVSATTWQWMFDADSGSHQSVARPRSASTPVWWLNADHSLGLGDHRQHLAGHPVQPGHPLRRAAEHPHRALRGGGRGRGDGAWRQFWSITFPLLRPVTAITLLLGFVYTLKVVDIIWIMTFGTGTSQTLATWAYGDGLRQGHLGASSSTPRPPWSARSCCSSPW